jgi:hypothetical protein
MVDIAQSGLAGATGHGTLQDLLARSGDHGNDGTGKGSPESRPGRVGLVLVLATEQGLPALGTAIRPRLKQWRVIHPPRTIRDRIICAAQGIQVRPRATVAARVAERPARANPPAAHEQSTCQRAHNKASAFHAQLCQSILYNTSLQSLVYPFDGLASRRRGSSANITGQLAHSELHYQRHKGACVPQTYERIARWRERR